MSLLCAVATAAAAAAAVRCAGCCCRQVQTEASKTLMVRRHSSCRQQTGLAGADWERRSSGAPRNPCVTAFSKPLRIKPAAGTESCSAWTRVVLGLSQIMTVGRAAVHAAGTRCPPVSRLFWPWPIPWSSPFHADRRQNSSCGRCFC
jgi:hypothetical protein